MKMKLDVDQQSIKGTNLTSREYLRKTILHFLDMDWPNVSSCTSAVIDAKIERAMDMVKKHLVYAMQEEVEVLKDRIVVLLDRIKQLEVENDFLKSNASPDVLRALTDGTAGAGNTNHFNNNNNNNNMSNSNTRNININMHPATFIEYDPAMQTEDLEVAAITANGNFHAAY